MKRAILHCDLNNFFASVECIKFPEYSTVPMAVTGDQEIRHGIILAKNKIAKALGVKTGEAIWQAKQKCPDLLVHASHYDLYQKYSKQVQEIYYRFTDKIEPFGIDESWLDVTFTADLFGGMEKLANIVKDTVKAETGLTISIGASDNKIYSKLGSDIAGPDSVVVITKQNYKDIVWSRPMQDLLYIGPATKRKLKGIGLSTIGDVARCDITILRGILGKNGELLYQYAKGIDTNMVSSFNPSSIKSVGRSITLPFDVTSTDQIFQVLSELSIKVSRKLRKEQLYATGIQISYKTTDLVKTQAQMQWSPVRRSSVDLAISACHLLLKNWDKKQPLRAIGVRCINVIPELAGAQVEFGIDMDRSERFEKIDEEIDNMYAKYGKDIIRYGTSCDTTSLYFRNYTRSDIGERQFRKFLL